MVNNRLKNNSSMNLIKIKKGYCMVVESKEAYNICLTESGIMTGYDLDVNRMQTLQLMKDEHGLEVSVISTISQKLEMNIIKYGGQFQALRNGIYDLVEFKGTLNSVKKVKKLNKNIDKTLEEVYVASFSKEVIPTVEGLKTRLPIFTAELKHLFNEIHLYGLVMLEELDGRIADFIGNPDTRQAFIQLNSDVETAKRFNKEVVSFIQRNINNSGNEVDTLVNIVANNVEYKDSVRNIVDTVELFSNKDLSKIETVVSKIEDRFEILLKVLKNDKESMTKEAMEALVNTLDTLSSFLTNLSAIYYLHVRSIDVALTVNDLIKTK